ncbi:MAG TPA: AraC family transcriptional regulator [Tenuifilaceae bacterium]|nr:AraC family transcriptional regulator [Tenuifilaceae bacterium]HPE17246.1 AraC family transcriptional regulator [Tenuifilaceae bacterium]HPJ44473.1 AraC family transcriptional regulator [Tenuifilaceae bacterium]HPQ33011.1 AraC family transcriptional regulator [Tenuifilaceae bacterium]HRX67942.1 AraC family transcriptional regulator [Tenuifilaceae bacterium]
MIVLSATGIVVNLFFLIWFLLVAKQNVAADRKLGVLYFLFLLVFIFNFYEFSGIMRKYPAFIFLDMGIPFLIGPVIWTYVLMLVKKQDKRSNNFIHYVPALLVYVLFIDIVLMEPDEKIRLLKAPASFESIRYQVVTILQLIPVPIYLFASIAEISSYNKKLKKVYSATDSINHRWLRFILTFFLIFWCVVSIGIVSINFLNETVLGMSIFMAGFIVFSFVTGVYGIKRNIAISNTIEEQATTYEEKTSIDIDIESFMQTNKTFLQAELTLYQLADNLKIPAHVLSRTLNSKYKTSFFDFVNNLRINEFKEKVRNKEHLKYSILYLAYDCGFNSKSSFYRFFKRVEGVTPSQFIKNTTIQT